MVDLHTHTTASDGELTPEDLVKMAYNAEVTTLAITDHDTVDGIEPAINEAKKYNIFIVPGIEISCISDIYSEEHHIIGLYIDHNNPELHKTIEKVQKFRETRNISIIKKLSQLGYPLTHSDISSINKEINRIGKPDIADLLVRKGYVNNRWEAFNRLLDNKKGEASIKKELVNIQEAITVIHNAGGVSILCHPDKIERDCFDFEKVLSTFTKYGLDGIEVFYTGYKKTRVKYYKRLATRFNLLLSGGSDFHYMKSYGQRLGFYGIKKNIPDYIADKIYSYKINKVVFCDDSIYSEKT